MDEVLRSRQRHVEYVVVAQPVPDKGPTPTAQVPTASQTQQELALRRGRRSAQWDEVRRLRAAGYKIQRIAREMGMHRRTVRRYLATPEVPSNRPPERSRPCGLSSRTLQQFVAYLQGRWEAGCTTVAQFERELEAQGYDILNDDERLATGYELLQRFRRLVARRSVRDLIQWLSDPTEGGLRPFASLARGIQADYAAVVN